MRIVAAVAPEKEKPSAAADPDRELVVRAKEGEALGFEELIAQHWPRVYGLVARVLGDPSDAVGVTGEAFLQAWRSLTGFRGEVRFSLWLYRIAIDEAGRRLADEAWLNEAWLAGLPLEGDRLQAPLAGVEPSAEADWAELDDYLARCLAELPADERVAVVLRDVEGLTNREAAYVLSLELGALKRRVHRGRMTLVRRLEARALGRGEVSSALRNS